MFRSILFVTIGVLSLSGTGCVHREIIREEPGYHAQKREEHREIKREERREERRD